MLSTSWVMSTGKTPATTTESKLSVRKNVSRLLVIKQSLTLFLFGRLKTLNSGKHEQGIRNVALYFT